MLKQLLRRIFAPILNIFEKGDGPYNYKPLNRKILLVVGVMFSGLGGAVTYLIFRNGEFGYSIPAIVFSVAGLVCLVVGGLGSDRAVSSIWNSSRS